MSDIVRMLHEMSERLFADACTPTLRLQAEADEWPAGVWSRLEEAGLPQTAVPESLGGAGATLADAMAVARSAGRHALPLPLVETVLANWLRGRAGLTALEGAATLCVNPDPRALLERGARGGWKLSIEASVVPWGLQSAHLLVPACCGSAGHALVTLKTQSEFFKPGRSAAGEPRDKLVLDGLELSEEQVHSADGSLSAQLLLAGALVRCHQMVGAMEWALEQTLTYARDRVQFGKPIGAFQAVQHLIAEMAAQVHAAAMATDMARMRLEDLEIEIAVAVAKARVGEAAGAVAAIAHQVHGAMGYSQEYPLHYRTRRLWSWREEFGGERYWQLRMGRKVAAAGGKAFWPGLTVVS